MNPPEPALERLASVDWFANLTRPISVSLPLAIQSVSDWPSAIELRGKFDSENAFLEARGRLTVALSANHRDSYRKWNDFVRSARETIDDAIIPTVSAALPSQDDAEFILSCVQWDAMNYVMEHVYSDLIPPAFYTLLYDVYAAGHFPCHWDEVWPDGRLWVA